MKTSYFIFAAIFAISMSVHAGGLPKIGLAKGFLETYKMCKQDGDCEKHQKIKQYNELAATCNERGTFGGQSKESVKACEQAEKIIAEAEANDDPINLDTPIDD